MSSPTTLQRWRAAMAPAAKKLLFHGGVYTAVRRFRPGDSVAILRYHAVCGTEGHTYAEPAICVTPDGFARHVAYLSAHYCVLPLPEIAAALRRRMSLPRNAVAITFDDGYADNLAAARVLHAHGLTATFYVTAGCLAGDEAFWVSELRALVTAIPNREFELTAAAKRLTFAAATAEDRRVSIRRLSRLIKSNPIRLREDLRRQLRDLAGDPPLSSPMLSWSEVAAMHRLGMTIGAHTLTHPNLPSAGREDAWREIAGAKARLERDLGVPATMFSYPNGGAERYITPEIQRMVQEAGYEAATTSTNGFAGPASDLYALERVQVSERLEDLIFALEVERFGFAPKERSQAGA
jgi:peptidoglycan/xylan/chitin deacetylase (PgdA/CDA1 family)